MITLLLDQDCRLLTYPPDLKRGDDLTVCLQYLDDQRRPVPPPDAVVMAAREQGGDIHVMSIRDWMPISLEDGSPALTGRLTLSGQRLADILTTQTSVTLEAEIESQSLDMIVSSQTFPLIIHDDLIKGDDAIDPDEVPTYATRIYVDNAIRSHIDLAQGEPGKDGQTPEIGPNGNWWVGGQDTYVPAVTDLSGYPRTDELPGIMDAAGYTRVCRLTQDEYEALPRPSDNSLYFTSLNH